MSTNVVRATPLPTTGIALVWTQDEGRYTVNDEAEMTSGAQCALVTEPLQQARAAERDTLAALIDRVADGDQAAFAELYDLTSARLYGMALRVVRDAEHAQDTLQEVYLQVWRNAGSYQRSLGSPMSWLLTMAHRRAVDRVRVEQSGSDREHRYGMASTSRDHDVVTESVTERMEAAAVRDCLASLSDAQRESVQLAYYQGWTYREVAERLGAALPTVKSRIRDGLIRLRACLGVDSHD